MRPGLCFLLEFDLVAAASVLELTGVEARTTAKEVVNLTRLDIVWEARDEESVDVASVTLLVKVIRIVWLLSHSKTMLIILERNGLRPLSEDRLAPAAVAVNSEKNLNVWIYGGWSCPPRIEPPSQGGWRLMSFGGTGLWALAATHLPFVSCACPDGGMFL